MLKEDLMVYYGQGVVGVWGSNSPLKAVRVVGSKIMDWSNNRGELNGDFQMSDCTYTLLKARCSS